MAAMIWPSVYVLAVGAASVIAGGLRSILLPPIGPASAQLPAWSQTERLSVAAAASSLPAATLVVSVKAASLEWASPAPMSAASHESATLPACQTPSELAQLMPGALRSIL